MANRMYRVRCSCGAEFFLTDTIEGPCPICNNVVKYGAPPVAPSTATDEKQPSRKPPRKSGTTDQAADEEVPIVTRYKGK